MKKILIATFCVLSLVGCHRRAEQAKASVTVQLPPAHTGNTADAVNSSDYNGEESGDNE